MTRIKLCGLKRPADIEIANQLKPDYVGFVFALKSSRRICEEEARELKAQLSSEIAAVGVFVNEPVENIAHLLNTGVIDYAQLHGNEDEHYIQQLRKRSAKPIIQAFVIQSSESSERANASTADYVLLDSGAGSGSTFNWKFIQNIHRPYFLAGGLNPENIATALQELHPFAVDVSSGIETDGVKDARKAAAFVSTVRRKQENKIFTHQSIS